MGAAYDGPRHKFLRAMGVQPWRTNGDTVERLELLAQMAVQWPETPKHFRHTAPVLEALHGDILPAIRACGEAERANSKGAFVFNHVLLLALCDYNILKDIRYRNEYKLDPA